MSDLLFKPGSWDIAPNGFGRLVITLGVACLILYSGAALVSAALFGAIPPLAYGPADGKFGPFALCDVISPFFAAIEPLESTLAAIAFLPKLHSTLLSLAGRLFLSVMIILAGIVT